MITQLMVKPSSLMPSGIRMSEFGDTYLFRFTDELQSRFEDLLSENKTGFLTPAEKAELAGISELSRIFTFINAQLALQAKWCPTKLDDWYEKELNTSVNIATHQST
ncbi:MAG: hypothetical protein F6J92_34425 [Symploca sp. SIO1A3]|nr:hypothetical protein [Symploca sp. SIO2C1]NER51651.1 hypothetical protein [Symploca sp. SIO1A3]